MEFEIVKGYDGKEYAKFPEEFTLDDYCVRHRISPTYYCVGGYMNSILLDDVATEPATQRNG